MTIVDTALDQGLDLLVILCRFQVVAGRFRTTFGRTNAANELMLSLVHELRDVVAATMRFTLTKEHICRINKSMDQVTWELQKPPAVKVLGLVN